MKFYSAWTGSSVCLSHHAKNMDVTKLKSVGKVRWAELGRYLLTASRLFGILRGIEPSKWSCYSRDRANNHTTQFTR